MTGYDLSLYIVKEKKSTLIGTGTEVQELYTYLKKTIPRPSNTASISTNVNSLS